MTIQELSELADRVERVEQIPMLMLCVPRRKGGPLKKIDRALKCAYVGGTVHDYLVSVTLADIRTYVAKNADNLGREIAARERTVPEKLSRELREQLGMPDPSNDPWRPILARVQATA